MQASGRDTWQGQIYNADDPPPLLRSSGAACRAEAQAKADARVEGCVLSILCKGQTWTRAN